MGQLSDPEYVSYFWWEKGNLPSARTRAKLADGLRTAASAYAKQGDLSRAAELRQHAETIAPQQKGRE